MGKGLYVHMLGLGCFYVGGGTVDKSSISSQFSVLLILAVVGLPLGYCGFCVCEPPSFVFMEVGFSFLLLWCLCCWFGVSGSPFCCCIL